MLNRLQDTGTPVTVQDTTLAIDVLGRFVCNTWDEAINNGGVVMRPGSGMVMPRPALRKRAAPGIAWLRMSRSS